MYTSLRMGWFKSFQDAEAELRPFTVLIGANASGKSNIRDAFSFLHGIGRGYSLAEILGEKYGEGGERVWTRDSGGMPEVAYSRLSLSCINREYSVGGCKEVRYSIEVGVETPRMTAH